MNMMALSTTLGGAFSAERLAYAGKMTLLGMMMIFAVLGLLWAVLAIFKVVFAGKSPKKVDAPKEPKETKQPKAQENAPAPSAPTAAPTEDLSLIAVLTAAVAAYREAEGESGGFRVVSFRRTSGGAWNAKK